MDINKLIPLAEYKDFFDVVTVSDVFEEDDQGILIIEFELAEHHKHLVTEQTMEAICMGLSDLLEMPVGISIIYNHMVH